MKLKDVTAALKQQADANEQDELVFIVIREQPQETATEKAPKGNMAKDKDVWNLTGPLQFSNKPKSDLDGLRARLGQQESKTPSERLLLAVERAPGSAKDKDVWNVTNPGIPQST